MDRRTPVRLLFVLGLVIAGSIAPGGVAQAAPPAPSPCTGTPCWHPALASRWQYQLQGVAAYASTGGINVNISSVPFTGGAAVKPSVFDIDLYVDPAIAGNNTTFNTAAVNAIHANGAKAICYVSAGTFEPWRPDVASYPESIKGRAVGGFKDEKWVDIRQTSILLPIMNARVAKCKQAGFDGVEWDTVDGYTNRTGFPLTASDQLFYNASLANLAHSYGLTVALKNDVEQLPDLGRTSTTRSTSSASSTASATATRRTSSARGRPSSRSSTSSGSRSSARQRTPRTGTRSSRRTTCSTRPGPLVDRSGISVGS